MQRQPYLTPFPLGGGIVLAGGGFLTPKTPLLPPMGDVPAVACFLTAKAKARSVSSSSTNYAGGRRAVSGFRGWRHAREWVARCPQQPRPPPRPRDSE